ncbi:MAG: tetratricopeptide repeat protein, partial [Thermoguttaceae bacterium]
MKTVSYSYWFTLISLLVFFTFPFCCDVNGGESALISECEAKLSSAIRADRGGNVEEATQLYSECIDFAEKNSIVAHEILAMHRLAILYAKTKQYDASEALFRRAISKSDQNVLLMCDYAKLCFDQKRFAESEMTLKKCLLQSPDNRRVLYNLGLSIAHQSDRQIEGLRYLKIAVGEIRGLRELAKICTEQGEINQANHAEEQALLLEKMSPEKISEQAQLSAHVEIDEKTKRELTDQVRRELAQLEMREVISDLTKTTPPVSISFLNSESDKSKTGTTYDCPADPFANTEHFADDLIESRTLQTDLYENQQDSSLNTSQKFPNQVFPALVESNTIPDVKGNRLIKMLPQTDLVSESENNVRHFSLTTNDISIANSADDKTITPFEESDQRFETTPQLEKQKIDLIVPTYAQIVENETKKPVIIQKAEKTAVIRIEPPQKTDLVFDSSDLPVSKSAIINFVPHTNSIESVHQNRGDGQKSVAQEIASTGRTLTAPAIEMTSENVVRAELMQPIQLIALDTSGTNESGTHETKNYYPSARREYLRQKSGIPSRRNDVETKNFNEISSQKTEDTNRTYSVNSAAPELQGMLLQTMPSETHVVLRSGAGKVHTSEHSYIYVDSSNLENVSKLTDEKLSDQSLAAQNDLLSQKKLESRDNLIKSKQLDLQSNKMSADDIRPPTVLHFGPASLNVDATVSAVKAEESSSTLPKLDAMIPSNKGHDPFGGISDAAIANEIGLVDDFVVTTKTNGNSLEVSSASTEKTMLASDISETLETAHKTADIESISSKMPSITDVGTPDVVAKFAPPVNPTLLVSESDSIQNKGANVEAWMMDETLEARFRTPSQLNNVSKTIQNSETKNRDDENSNFVSKTNRVVVPAPMSITKHEPNSTKSELVQLESASTKTETERIIVTNPIQTNPSQINSAPENLIAASPIGADSLKSISAAAIPETSELPKLPLVSMSKPNETTTSKEAAFTESR